jgi:hypothetical protein
MAAIRLSYAMTCFEDLSYFRNYAIGHDFDTGYSLDTPDSPLVYKENKHIRISVSKSPDVWTLKCDKIASKIACKLGALLIRTCMSAREWTVRKREQI